MSTPPDAAPPPSPLHVAEYAIEAAALATFMLSAALVSLLLEHPASPVRQALPVAASRRALAGMAMGLTAAALIYSPWGRRSGAHMNPAVTLTFLRLGKVEPRDAIAYVVAQCVGATLAMAAVVAVAGPLVADPAVNYLRTVPGHAGPFAALLAEALISFGMMLVVLGLSNSRWRGYTGLAAATLVATYITVESPLSGMSMNPARTLGPAVVSGMLGWTWIYVVAPLSGMLAAAELFVRARGLREVACAKLHHDARARCIFRCAWQADVQVRPLPPRPAGPAVLNA